MEDDKERLTRWSDDEDWGDYLIRKQALDGSRERFKACEEKYFNVLTKRITICENILKRKKDFFVNYTLACLHDKDDVDRSPETLYKRKVIYYCNQAIKLDPQFVPAWVLLAKSYEWIATLGGESKRMPQMQAVVDGENVIVRIEQGGYLESTRDKQNASIPDIEKAIACIKRAMVIDPLKKKYQEMLKGYYYQRNEEYRQ